MQLGTDNFSRIVSSGLGTASDGQVWTVNSGTTSHYSVGSDNKGHYSYDSGIYSKLLLGYGVSQDFNFIARFTPASSNDFYGFYFRYISANDNCSAQINAAGQYSATIFSGGTEYDYTGGGAGITPGQPYWLRVNLASQGIQMRAWADGATEPTTWGATFTIAPTAWTGQYGLILRVGTTSTSIAFDSFTATNNITTVLSTLGAWIFPGSTAVGGTSDVPTELADGRRIDRLNPQYWTCGDGVNGTAGVLIEDTVAAAGWDGYSSTNASLVKQHSTQQLITISGVEGSGRTAISTLATDSTKRTNFCNTLVTFCQTNGFTGIDLDFEHRGGWTNQATLWGQLKTVITALGNALHAANLKLAVDGPAFTAQGSISWNWNDLMTNCPVDYALVQAYDHFYDTLTGTSTSPGPDYAQSPTTWLTSLCSFMISQVPNINQIIMGVTSEAYYINNDDTSFGSVSENTGAYGYNDAAGWTGFSSATREKTSCEMMWSTGGKTYVYCDEVTMNQRIQAVLSTGIPNVNIWFIGSANKWPTVLATSSGGGGGGGGGGSSTGITLTNAGLNLIRDGLNGATNPLISWVALGTGTGSATVGDTQLEQEVYRKAVTSYTNGGNPGELIIVMYLSPGDAINIGIQEIGFFGGSSATSAPNSGILFARGLYNHTKLNSESIQFILDFTA